jgi:peptidyl-dipeptidase Dcp
MHNLAREIMPKLMAFESDINLDEALFARVKKAFEGSKDLPLTPEQKTLAEKTYKGFVRNGALLNADQKAKLRAIDTELSTLGPQFSQHVLKVTNAYELHLTKEGDVSGLPQSARDAAQDTAREKGKDGWVFTLQGPSVIAFLKYADRRDLREAIWRAFNSRAYQGEFSNQELVKKIASLRHRRAKLLGYKTHAAFQVEERMAETPANVWSFLERLCTKTKTAADREMAELKTFMQEKGGGSELMPWDYAYWANKLKEERYAFNAEDLRPYFELSRVLQGAFLHAEKLFDLSFTEIRDVPVYAPDVKAFTVAKASTGDFLGLFYTDFFPRATKGGGAWCTRYKGQWIENGHDHRPHVSIVCNFTKPTGSLPSLLTFQEVVTLFHEFGHALHGLLSKVQYRSLSCTNVYRDFVELPSQIMENWVKQKESLRLFARHYETNAVIPDDLVDRMIASENFHAAYFMMRQLRFGYLDMSWYDKEVDDSVTIEQFEREALKGTDLLPVVPGTTTSCAFEHIFSGGYSAGYYGYKWAEVLDSDAFELFLEKGLFNRSVAEQFSQAILSRGGSEHPMMLYKLFRGRAPDPDALLRRSGLL